MFKMRDEKGIDDKIICVPLDDPNWNVYEQLEDLPPLLREEIEQSSRSTSSSSARKSSSAAGALATTRSRRSPPRASGSDMRPGAATSTSTGDPAAVFRAATAVSDRRAGLAASELGTHAG
jgi:hypothetical protein